MTTDDAGAAAGTEPAPSGQVPSGRSIWLLSDIRRSVLAIGVAAVPTLAGQVWARREGSTLHELAETDVVAAVLLLPTIVWLVYAAAYTVLTALAYRGLSGARLRSAVAADPTWARMTAGSAPTSSQRLLGSGPATWSLFLGAAALLAVVALLIRPTLRDVPLALVVALVMVAVSWVSVAQTFAVHYARVDGLRPGLRFPGEPAVSLSDYLYLALAVQSTFGTTDVEVGTSELRRQVTAQAVLAFVYNTVILAMVVSLLLNL